WGLSAPEIAQGIAFTTTTFWLGVFTVGGVALLLGATPVGAFTVIPVIAWHILGAALVMAVVAYLSWSAMGGRALTLRGWAFAAPRPPLALAQVVLSAVDWVLAGIALYL